MQELQRKQAWLRRVGKDGPDADMMRDTERFNALLNLTAPSGAVDEADTLFPFWLFLDVPKSQQPRQLSPWQKAMRFTDVRADHLMWLPDCSSSVGSYLRRLDAPRGRRGKGALLKLFKGSMLLLKKYTY